MSRDDDLMGKISEIRSARGYQSDYSDYERYSGGMNGHAQPMMSSLARLQAASTNHRIAELEERLANEREVISGMITTCLLYTSPSPRDLSTSRMPSSA